MSRPMRLCCYAFGIVFFGSTRIVIRLHFSSEKLLLRLVDYFPVAIHP